MIIWLDRPFANDHLDGTASCKQSSGWTSLLQMILLFLLHYSSPPQKNIFSFSKYFPPFSLLLIFCAAENIFSVSKYIPHFYFLVLFSSERNIFSLSKCNVPFPSLFYFSSAKKNSFSKYPPPFPSLFIFSSKDPKLKIQES